MKGEFTNPFNVIDYSHSGNCIYAVCVGRIQIATVFMPRKGKRDYHMVRLDFTQDRGKVDFTKDRKFATMEDAKGYIHREFKKLVKELHRYYVLNNND